MFRLLVGIILIMLTDMVKLILVVGRDIPWVGDPELCKMESGS